MLKHPVPDSSVIFAELTSMWYTNNYMGYYFKSGSSFMEARSVLEYPADALLSSFSSSTSACASQGPSGTVLTISAMGRCSPTPVLATIISCFTNYVQLTIGHFRVD